MWEGFSTGYLNFQLKCAGLETEYSEVTWESFKAAFREKFRDVRPDQFYFSKLQTAKQGKN